MSNDANKDGLNKPSDDMLRQLARDIVIEHARNRGPEEGAQTDLFIAHAKTHRREGMTILAAAIDMLLIAAVAGMTALYLKT